METAARPRILIALPALNEERVLEGTVQAVRAFAAGRLPDCDVHVVVADNGSSDATADIGRRLAAAHPDVGYLRTPERGKGRAIRAAWLSGPADVYVFMDADLATDLAALPALVAAVRGGADLAIGSRALPGSDVERTLHRLTLSYGYRTLLWAALGSRLRDVPCGFKAASADTVRALLPETANDAWFFDSEFTLRAEAAGRRIVEVPVRWRDAEKNGRKSKVRFGRIMSEYLREVIRLRRELAC